jgi:tetratricopeptide (TPR) repeat protein
LLDSGGLRKLRTIRKLRSAVLRISDGFGQRLRRLRIEKGLTQAQLGEPYSGAFVSQIERGRRVPRPEPLALFAKRLGVTPEELATGVSPSFESDAFMQLQDGWRSLYLGRYGRARRAFKAAASAADRLSNPVLRARGLVGLARCCEYEGQTADALRLYSSALHHFETAPKSASVEAVAGIARCHQMSGSPRLALHVLERYLLELEQEHLSDPAALMRVYASLVWPYSELGLFAQAGDAATRALKLQSRVGDPEEVASMHLNAARALLDGGRSNDALESLKKAEEIFRDLNWSTEIARAQTNRGIVLTTIGDLDGAQGVFVEALATYRAVGFVRGEARTLNELARLERKLGKTDEAETFARQALELLVEMEALPELALTHRELGLCLTIEDPTAAEAHLREAIALYERCDEIDHAADTCRLLGDMLEQREPHAGALEYRSGLLLISGRLGRMD